MKILRAEFQNFKGLYSGLGKYNVTLDFQDMPNIITVIIGEMGSGKTTILSHLQPWATVGTLDERNTDGIIIDEMNGSKRLVFKDGPDIYDINHNWKWDKDHHTLKSYIKKNGEELNPNGNQSSFKELVELEMGVDQNFLRLSRLGPNVANVIEMTATARKEYLATRLTDVDLYLAISKDMNELAKTLSAQAQLLTKKFSGVTEDDIENAKGNLKSLAKDITNTHSEVVNLNGSIGMILGECNTLTGGLSLKAYQDEIESYEKDLNKLFAEKNEIVSNIDRLSLEYENISDVDKEIGKLEATIESNIKSIENLQEPRTIAEQKRDNLAKLKAASGNSAYIEQLSKMYSAHVAQCEEYENTLSGFSIEESSTQINALMTDIQTFDSLLHDVITHNSDSVRYILKRPSYDDALKASMKNIETLQGKKFNLQKSLNNLGYLGSYQATEELTLPTECKCFSSCPFYRTHPNVVKTEINDFTKKQKEILNEVQAIDSRIDQLLEYPIIIGILKKLKVMLPTIADKLRDINALKSDSLYEIITGNHIWYDYDRISYVLECTVKREKLYEIKAKLPDLKNELDKYSSIDIGNITAELDKAEDAFNGICEAIADLEFDTQSKRHELSNLKNIRDEFQNIEMLNKHKMLLESDIQNLNTKLIDMRSNVEKVIERTREMQGLKERAKVFEYRENSLRNEYEKLNTRIMDWENSKTEFDEIAKELNVINLIKEASSAKKGIPLIYIRIFLNDCIDIINELISMVFDDSIEIKEFNITEKDFFIPYYKNGTLIDDVRSASQGERAIITLALSFALIRKGVAKYNILLLDEIDGPLYSKDREKFLMILAQQIQAINAEQVFLITHNNAFDGYPINIVATTPEHIDNSNTPVLFV